ncbi:hypothetical protein MMC11_005133 [Xylographa trunciseda]|nr:hypothetical protein [Xylographa trunciseda]
MPGPGLPMGPPGALGPETPSAIDPMPVNRLNELYMQQQQGVNSRLETDGSNHVYEHVSPPQLPIVACFLANQTDGNPFRVSLHSWEHPNPSQTLQVVTQHGKTICYEARVFIDGLCVAGMLFLDQGPWPQVIEMSSKMDKEGNRDFLRWPHFHPEMLTQSYWNAGENKGRIKVTLTEGYLNGPGNLPFTRTKNLVTFSFQHAPQQVLENCGIAWPNAGMWYQSPHPMYNVASPVKKEPSPETIDLHAHSPRRRQGSIANLQETLASKMSLPPNIYKAMQPSAGMQPFASQDINFESRAAAWNSLTRMPDPFIEGSRTFIQNQYPTRLNNKSDVSMPDYSRSITPASSRNLTNEIPTHMRPFNTLQNQESFSSVMLPLFNTRENDISGVVAPANTRVSSAANTPPVPSRPSAAAEARAASYSKERSRAVSITTKDAPPKARTSSDVSMQSGFSEDQASTKDIADVKVHIKPASDVKGRKEGRASELDIPTHVQKKSSNGSVSSGMGNKENSTTRITTTVVLSDGKRKRASTIPQITSKDEEALGSSPTRKAPKKQTSKGHINPGCGREPIDDTLAERSPLGSLDNLV